MKKLSVLSAVIVISFAGWLYATPYLALNKIRSAAENKDYATLQEKIDFATLRENFKIKMRAIITKGLETKSGTEQDKAMSDFGKMIVDALIDPIINSLITPENISSIVRGETPPTNLKSIGKSLKDESSEAADAAINNESLEEVKDEQGAATTEQKTQTVNNVLIKDTKKPNLKIIANYNGLNNFVVKVIDVENPESEVQFILTREKLINWKMKDILIPALEKIEDDLNKKEAELNSNSSTENNTTKEIKTEVNNTSANTPEENSIDKNVNEATSENTPSTTEVENK
jgi:hypothetical protein